LLNINDHLASAKLLTIFVTCYFFNHYLWGFFHFLSPVYGFYHLQDNVFGTKFALLSNKKRNLFLNNTSLF